MSNNSERGSVSTIVAALLGFGVILGMMAISLDVGNLMWERRQLQSSADAGAASLARTCWGSQGANCTATADALGDLVDKNAADKTAGIESICATNVPGKPATTPNCGVGTGAYADCSPLPPYFAGMAGLPYVEVRTRTQTATAGGGRVNWLTNFVAGAIGIKTSSVGACARAAIGTPSSGKGDLPITLSACEWQRATGGTVGGGGGAYYPAPVPTSGSPKGYGAAGQPAWPAGPLAPPAVGQGREVVLLVQNPPGGQTAPSPCPSWQGHALPGGFGILETEAGDTCKLKEYPHHWMHTSTGNNTSCALNNLVGKLVSVPVFDCTTTTAPGVAPPVGNCSTGNGNNAYFHRVGYAAFYLSGYHVTAAGGIPNRVASVNPNNTTPNGQNPCSNSETCISGWFVSSGLTSTVITGPPNGAGYFGQWGVVPAG